MKWANFKNFLNYITGTVGGKMKKRTIVIEECKKCPIFNLNEGEFYGENLVQLTCKKIGRSEIVRSGNVEDEISILSDWFYNVCDLDVIKE